MDQWRKKARAPTVVLVQITPSGGAPRACLLYVSGRVCGARIVAPAAAFHQSRSCSMQAAAAAGSGATTARHCVRCAASRASTGWSIELHSHWRTCHVLDPVPPPHLADHLAQSIGAAAHHSRQMLAVFQARPVAGEPCLYGRWHVGQLGSARAERLMIYGGRWLLE